MAWFRQSTFRFLSNDTAPCILGFDMRPTEVTLTTLLMAVLNLFGYALLLGPKKPRNVEVALIFITLMITAGYVVLWYYWQGHNWARILVFLTCFLCFYNLRSLVASNLLVRIMIVGEAAVALFLVCWLNTDRARAFFQK